MIPRTIAVTAAAEYIRYILIIGHNHGYFGELIIIVELEHNNVECLLVIRDEFEIFHTVHFIVGGNYTEIVYAFEIIQIALVERIYLIECMSVDPSSILVILSL